MTDSSTHTEVIEEAALLIEQFNPELAKCWRDQPFRRVTLAHSFAAGFVKDPSEDVNENADVVLRVAYLDRDIRQMEATSAAEAVETGAPMFCSGNLSVAVCV